MSTAALRIDAWRSRQRDPGTPRFFQVERPGPLPAPRDELVAGLLAPRPWIAPKFFYDELGSHLFEAITLLDEYYPTRTEAAVLRQHADAIAASTGRGATLIDLGAGNCAKAAALFPLLRPSAYVAVDISVEFVRRAVERLAAAHPAITMAGVGMDFSESLDLPDATPPGAGPPLFFYPGSSIGNFTPEAAAALLARVRARAAGGGLLIGIDLVKPAAQLERAYDDAIGVTAAFNRNVLRHANRVLGADFVPERWRHVARFDARLSRVEMHLEAEAPMTVRWPDGERHFAAGERIHTESAYKYTTADFASLLREAGFGIVRHWTDDDDRFAVFHAGAR